MKLLLTCFEPFGGELCNASALAAALLPDRIGPWELLKFELPVVFALAGKRCLTLIETLRPDAVLMLGQAAGRSSVTPELVARNLRWARLPDNEGHSPKGQSVIPEGEDALFAGLPAERLTEAIQKAGLPAELSCSAGYYVCNDLYYTVLYHLRGDVPALFIHVPSVDALSSEVSALALKAVIEAIDPIEN